MDGHSHTPTDTVDSSWASMSSESWDLSTDGEIQAPDDISLESPWFGGPLQQQPGHILGLQQQCQQQRSPLQAQHPHSKPESDQQPSALQQQEQPVDCYFQNALPTPLQTPLGTPSSDQLPHLYNSFQTPPPFDPTTVQLQPTQGYQLETEYFPSPATNMATNPLPDSDPRPIASTQMPILHNASAPVMTTAEANTHGFEYQVVIKTPMIYTPRRVLQGPSKTRETSPSLPTPAENLDQHQHVYAVAEGTFTASHNFLPTSTAAPDVHIEVKMTVDEEEEEEIEDEAEIRRQRNKVAASKCRLKRKGEANRLEVLAKELQAINKRLVKTETEMRDEVYYLKNEVLRHSMCDSGLIRGYLLQEAKRVAEGAITNVVPYLAGTSRVSRIPRTSRPAN